MSPKRTAAVVVVVGVLAAWLSAAMTPSERARPALAVVATPVDARGAELASEIARLHERLSPDATPAQPSRNLFRFRAAAVRPLALATTKPSDPEPAASPAPAPEPLALKLAGIAEDPGPDGPVRTAIISSSGPLFLVKEGDSVTSSYRVVKIMADRVDLAGTRDGLVRHLDLK